MLVATAQKVIVVFYQVSVSKSQRAYNVITVALSDFRRTVARRVA